uniref:RNA-binding protein 48 isoform X2 n=1 Tax=Ciona intestinalis TaxID=7719 RepID=UPI000EF4C65F|nr:RNA-binding protein 48 isoform X2 [Ciona intestinalis]|eukprot:XP_026690567.1 RNA-binding protein 48 isoform X2 [Ciona intestinalis]
MAADVSVPKHHVKQEYCDVRPKYRRGKKRTSVRVFTVNSESTYLVVANVPATKLEKDLLKLFSIYGTIVKCEELKDYPKEEFTQVFLIKYDDIQRAKTAKKSLDEHYFFGAMLHVCYAPEYEAAAETRHKIRHRRFSVVSRIKFLEKERPGSSKNSKVKQKYEVKKNTKKMEPSITNSKFKQNSTNSTFQQNSDFSTNPAFSAPPCHLNGHNIIGPCYPINHNYHPSQPQCSNSAIPLFLPPPPPPNNFKISKKFNPLHQQNTDHFEPRIKKGRLNQDLIEENPIKVDHSTSQKIIKLIPKKPKAEFKTKPGYFHQKIQTKSSFDTNGIKVSHTDKINDKPDKNSVQNLRTVLPPVIKPPFLPRHFELKNIEEINKVDLDEKGNIPLLGSFLLEKRKPS